MAGAVLDLERRPIKLPRELWLQIYQTELYLSQGGPSHFSLDIPIRQAGRDGHRHEVLMGGLIFPRL